MRRFISALMILCLLQVTTFAAIPVDSTSTHHTSVSSAQSATIYIAIPADPNAETPPLIATQVSSLKERLTSTVAKYYSWLKAKSQARAARVIIVPSFFVACACLMFCIKLFATMYEGDAPLDASYGFLMHRTPTTFAASDTCVLQYLDYSSHIRNRYSHTANPGDALTLPQAVQDWLSNAPHVLGAIDSASVNARHDDLNHTEYDALKAAAHALLHNSGVESVHTPISCAVVLGDGTTPPQVIGCEDGLTSDTPNGQATLQLYSPSGQHARHLLTTQSIYLHVPGITMSQELRYPESDYSLDYGNVNRAMVVDSRRMLLQASNTLALPDAVKHWLSNADHWLSLAGETATLLRQGKCPSTQQANELNDLTRTVFEANQALFTRGSVRCDLDHANRVFVFNCTHDTEPKDYDHTANCPNVRVNVERDAAIWLVPYTGKPTYSTFLLSINPTPATPAPAPAPTLEPTPAPKPKTPTLELNDTASKTLEPTHSPTLPHTLTHARPHTITPSVPVKNTTIVLYWGNIDGRKISKAHVNTTSWSLVNPSVWISGSIIPSSFYPDFQNGYLYLGETDLSVIKLNNDSHPIFSSKHILDSSTGVFINTFVDRKNSKIYMFKQGTLLVGKVNLTDPISITERKQIATLDTPSIYGLFVDSLYSFVFVSDYLIKFATMSNLTHWVTLPTGQQQDLISGIYILNNKIYWRDSSSIYSGDINRTNPKNITNIRTLARHGYDEFNIGYGGFYVEEQN